jgi:GT2 family glycosyltransferase
VEPRPRAAETMMPPTFSFDLPAQPTVAVVIPTFRRPEMLQTLLVSLSQGLRIPDEVIVVDNDLNRSARPDVVPGLPICVIHAGLGISVAGARNAGWRAASSDVVVFIDDDNVVEPDAIGQLVDALRPGGIGLAGPVIFAGDQGTVWCAGIRRSPWTGRTHNLLGGGALSSERSEWHTEDMPDAFAVPRVVLTEVGGFDDQTFPIHYEEADLGARIRALGLRTIVVRDAAVRHYGWVGVSPGRALVRATMSHGEARARQMALSRIRFHARHSRGLQRLSTVGVFIPLWALVTCLGCLPVEAPMRERWATIRAVGAGAVTGYRELLRGAGKPTALRSSQAGRRPANQ